MAKSASYAAAFPNELKEQFFLNSRWQTLERADLDRVPPAFRPPTSCPTPLKLHFIDEGDDDAPQAVVCVHGNPTWSFYWRKLIPALAERCRVIAPDHIGMGLSDKPTSFPYRLENHIANLETLIDALNLRDITLIVHDWGGAIGMGYATRHPENIRRIVVLNTAAFPIHHIRLPWQLALARTPLLGAMLVRGFNAFVRGCASTGTSQPGGLSPTVRLGYVWPYSSWAKRVAVHRFVQDIPLRDSHPTMATLRAIDAGLATLADKPMLIGWGMKDFVFRPEIFLPEWLKRFPRAEVQKFEAAGHLVLEDAGDTLIPMIRQFIGA